MPSLSKWRRQIKRTPNSNHQGITNSVNDKLTRRRRYARRGLNCTSSGNTSRSRKPRELQLRRSGFFCRSLSARGDWQLLVGLVS